MVKVSDAIKAFEDALAKLKTLNPDAEVVGNFYEGGYSDEASPMNNMYFSIQEGDNSVQEENIVGLTAAFIFND